MGRERTAAVSRRRSRLRASSITRDAVLQTVRDATAVGAGGFVDTTNQRLALRHVPAVYTPEQLGEIVIGFRAGTQTPAVTNAAAVIPTPSTPMRIKDVAEVTYDYAPPIGDAIINSRLGLLPSVAAPMGRSFACLNAFTDPCWDLHCV